MAIAATVPHWFLDELLYMKAGSSIAQGDGLQFEGESWGYGPVLPALIGALAALTADQEATYVAIKGLNALLFASAAVPVYLLSRRLLREWPSVAVAALTVALPSSAYVSVVMTEAAAFPAAAWALYAAARALETRAVRWQLLALAAIGLATLVRPQLGAMGVAFLASLAAVELRARGWPSAVRRAPRDLWPALAAVALAVAAAVANGMREGGWKDGLGAYASAAEAGNALAVVKWTFLGIGDLALYLAVAPIAVAPLVLLRLTRSDDVREWGFAAHAATQVATMLVVSAVGTVAGIGILHDRYLIYGLPLLLILFFWWVQEGFPRDRGPLLVGVAGTLAAVAALPFGTIAESSWFNQFEAVATELWGKVATVAEHLPVTSLRFYGIGFALAVCAVLLFGSRRWLRLLPALLALVFAANLALAWRSAYVDPVAYALRHGASRTWVDDQVGQDARVAIFHVGPSCRPPRERERIAAIMTDFFNRSVRRFSSTDPIGLKGRAPDRVLADGRVVTSTGDPLVADYVVLQEGVRLRGRPIARGTDMNLVLWQPNGPVTIISPRGC